jgi:hypothetical protein
MRKYNIVIDYTSLGNTFTQLLPLILSTIAEDNKDIQLLAEYEAKKILSIYNIPYDDIGKIISTVELDDVITIIRKNHPITVKAMRVCELVESKCSAKFLTNELDGEEYVYVKCNQNGKFEYRGKQERYSLFSITEHKLVEDEA